MQTGEEVVQMTSEPNVSAPSSISPTSKRGSHLPEPPPVARKWVKYVLAFGVSVAAGLAPFLGKYNVPGFDALLNLIPLSLQRTVLPLSALLMGVVAVAVQWYGGERLGRERLGRAFARCLTIMGLSLIALILAHAFFVVVVPILGGKESVAFVVGWDRPMVPPCEANISDAECIGLLTLDPSRVESFWGDRQIRFARLSLIFPYLFTTAAFGALVGLLVLKDSMRRN